MKNFIELKYSKNSKHEIVFENLDEIKQGDNVLLRLTNGDLSPVFYLDTLKIPHNIKLFIPSIQCAEIVDKAILHLTDDGYDDNFLHTFDCCNDNWLDSDIVPKWNIPKGSAILFLSEDDEGRYAFDLNQRHLISYSVYPEVIYQINDENVKTISIILPELHAEDKNCLYHIDNINKVCKELKEKYGVERVELFVSHCFVARKYKYTCCQYSSFELDYKFDNWNKYSFDLKKDFNNKPIKRNSFIPIVKEIIINDNTTEFRIEKEYELTQSIESEKHSKCGKLEFPLIGLMTIDDFNPLHDGGEEYNYGECIDKIITTNSTGILEVQKSDTLEVIDCIEFFKD